MCGAEIRLAGLNALNSHRLINSSFKQLNAIYKWRTSLMLPLPTDATVVRTDASPLSVGDHHLFKNIWIHASRHTMINTDGKDEREFLNGKGPLGH